MASLYDVARLAGVSTSTVSRVINDEYGVKDSTKVKVNKAIDECGYMVNQVAKDLKSQKTNLIGVIVPTMSSKAVAMGVDGISKIFEERQKHVLLANSQHRYEKEVEYINLFNRKRVEGIILYATHLDKALIKTITTSKAPVVIVGQDGSFHDIPSIIHDDVRVGFSAGQRLLKNGAKQIGFIGVSIDDIAVDSMRYSGLEQSLREEGLGEPVFHSRGDFTIESGYQLMKSELKSNANIDGVFCATDKIAIGAMRAIAEVGLTPGKEIKVLGVGNDEMSSVVKPSLSTFSYAFDIAGETAAKALLDIVVGKQNVMNKVVLGFDKIERETC